LHFWSPPAVFPYDSLTRRIFNNVLKLSLDAPLPIVHMARFLDPRTVHDIIIPTARDDVVDDGTEELYTPYSLEMIKRVFAVLAAQLQRAQEQKSTNIGGGVGGGAADVGRAAGWSLRAAVEVRRRAGRHTAARPLRHEERRGGGAHGRPRLRPGFAAALASASRGALVARTATPLPTLAPGPVPPGRSTALQARAIRVRPATRRRPREPVDPAMPTAPLRSQRSNSWPQATQEWDRTSRLSAQATASAPSTKRQV
jgi:hypothetical protein